MFEVVSDRRNFWGGWLVELGLKPYQLGLKFRLGLVIVEIQSKSNVSDQGYIDVGLITRMIVSISTS